MFNYVECPIEDFNRAMKIIRDTPYTEISTDLLYIAFTKYCADYRWTCHVHNSLCWSIKKKRDELGNELESRGIKVMY